MFKTNFFGHNKIWGTMPLLATGLGCSAKNVENHWSVRL